MPALHENALRGMALYGVPLDALPGDNSVLGGMNTGIGNWTVMIETDATDSGQAYNN